MIFRNSIIRIHENLLTGLENLIVCVVNYCDGPNCEDVFFMKMMESIVILIHSCNLNLKAKEGISHHDSVVPADADHYSDVYLCFQNLHC
jgi:hypothetical protein